LLYAHDYTQNFYFKKIYLGRERKNIDAKREKKTAAVIPAEPAVNAQIGRAHV